MAQMTKNNIQPGIEQLLVRTRVEKKTSASGMVLPDNNEGTQTMSGEVVLTGLATMDGGPELQEARQTYFDGLIGLSVIFLKGAPIITLLDGDDKYVFVQFSDVLGLTNDRSKRKKKNTASKQKSTSNVRTARTGTKPRWIRYS